MGKYDFVKEEAVYPQHTVIEQLQSRYTIAGIFRTL